MISSVQCSVFGAKIKMSNGFQPIVYSLKETVYEIDLGNDTRT